MVDATKHFFDVGKGYENIYKKWGEYGWVPVGPIPVPVFHNAPIDQRDADETIMKHYDSAAVKEMLNDISELQKNKTILNEAIQCFENRTYRGCAMILVSLIDRETLKLQSRTQASSPNKSVAVGKKSIEHAEVLFFKADFINEYNTTENYAYNMVAFLNSLFSNSTGFWAKNIPATINRNFLMHGMQMRPVKRRDCIKLFCAYSHLMFIKENARLKPKKRAK